MYGRIVTFENAYYRNILFVIEELLYQIPRPAYIDEKPGRSITKYTFQEPVRKEDFEKKQGRITVNYSQTITTEFSAMTGLIMEKDPIIFECFQEEEAVVLVRGCCTKNVESTTWIKPIFDMIWQEVLASFAD